MANHLLTHARVYNYRRRGPVRIVVECACCKKMISIKERGCPFLVTYSQLPDFFEALAGECIPIGNL